jgi:TRAP-type C4-dicarboxylate transport system permease small subunit
MRLLQQLDHYLDLCERALVITLLTGLLGLGLLQMLLRNLLASGLFWGDALLRHMVLWLGLLGASLATRQRQHLSMDALARLLPAWCQPWLTILSNTTAMVVCSVLVQAAWRFTQDEYTAGTALLPGVPTWLAVSVMPLAFLLMTLRFALRLLEALQQWRERSWRV